MKKLFIFILFSQLAFGLQGKISLYSGFTFEGEITTVERTHALIIPQSLTTTYEIGIDEIKALVLDNGFIMVLDGRVEQLYRNGKFLTKTQALVEDGYEPEINYTDEVSLDGDEYFDESELTLTNSDYYSLALITGLPVYVRPTMLKKLGNTGEYGKPASIPNLGISMNWPYYEIGPVDLSPGGRIVTIGFQDGQIPSFQALSIGGVLNIDFTPVLFFLPENMHIETIQGLTMLMGIDGDYSGGGGMIFGGNIDYWVSNYPIKVRLFGEFHVIPQSDPVFPSLKTGFGTIGLSASLIMKRGKRN
ncbi:MAG: hypothetical protein ISR83_00650 [Candidatus Marinimicrobia bacterium]|nr:hypothetical protein [Candidatus Neomarinimicrobiota bacterium]